MEVPLVGGWVCTGWNTLYLMLPSLSYSPSLYSFYHPLPYGDVRTDFSVLYDSWPFNYSFVHSLNRTLFSTNHMQAPRTQRSKMLILVLINVTVHYSSSLTLLFCSGNTPCPHCHFPCVTFPALLTLQVFKYIGFLVHQGVESWAVHDPRHCMSIAYE